LPGLISAWVDSDGPSVEQFAEANGLGLHCVDGELDEILSLTKPHERGLAYGGFTGFLIASVITAVVLSGPILVVPLLGILLSPFVFLALIALILGHREARDEFMANEIIRVCEREGYSEVLVLCGDNHVSGISRRLRKTGWDVDSERTLVG
jgi:hypothetical protein